MSSLVTLIGRAHARLRLIMTLQPSPLGKVLILGSFAIVTCTIAVVVRPANFLWEVPYEEASYIAASNLDAPFQCQVWSPHPPLFNTCVSKLSSMVGQPVEEVGRALSVLGFLLCGVLMYFVASANLLKGRSDIATLLVRSQVATLATVALLTMPRFCYHSRVYRPELWALLAGLMLVAVVPRSLSAPSVGRLLLIALSASLLAALNIYGALILIAFAIASLVVDHGAGSAHRLISVSALVLPALVIVSATPNYFLHVAVLEDHYWGLMKDQELWRRLFGFFGDINGESMPLIGALRLEGWYSGVVAVAVVLFVGCSSRNNHYRFAVVALLVSGLLISIAHEAFGISPVQDYLTLLSVLLLLGWMDLIARAPSRMTIILVVGIGGIVASRSDCPDGPTSAQVLSNVAREAHSRASVGDLPVIIAGPRLYMPLRWHTDLFARHRLLCYRRTNLFGDRWCGSCLVDDGAEVDDGALSTIGPTEFVLISMQASGGVYPTIDTGTRSDRRSYVHPSLAVGMIVIENVKCFKRE